MADLGGDVVKFVEKKMIFKHLMRVADLCRENVSQLNYGGYSLRGGRTCHIPSRENALNQLKLPKKKLNNG
jgi:hypothetical protein